LHREAPRRFAKQSYAGRSGDPKAWLSELFYYEDFIKDCIKELKLVII
jgi:hypothetical protein